MSRYTLDPHLADGTIVATVGWDAALETFFGQVEQFLPGLENGMLAWFGQTTGEISDVGTLIWLMRPWADVPEEIEAALKADRAATPAPTPFQRMMREGGWR